MDKNPSAEVVSRSSRELEAMGSQVKMIDGGGERKMSWFNK